jgi:multiple antibiotic resistance protein
MLVQNAFALLAITNPFGNLPVFISMSDDLDRKDRDKLFKLVVFTALLIVFIFTIIGTTVMRFFFQVNLSELRVAGGIILIVMGIRHLAAPREMKEHNINVQDDAIHTRIIPMAFPLLVGPGTLSTVIIIRHEAGMFITLAAILITFILILLLFGRANFIEKLFGKLTLFVLSRIMQVFIMAIGVKMLITGLKSIFPFLA